MVRFRVRINEHFIRNIFDTAPYISHFVNLYLQVRAIPNSYNNQNFNGKRHQEKMQKKFWPCVLYLTDEDYTGIN